MTVARQGFIRNSRILFGDGNDSTVPWWGPELQLFNDLIDTISIGSLEGQRGSSYGKQTVGGHQHVYVCHLPSVAGIDGYGNANIVPAVCGDASGNVVVSSYGASSEISLLVKDSDNVVEGLIISANTGGVVTITNHSNNSNGKIVINRNGGGFMMPLPGPDAPALGLWYVDASGFVKIGT